jgi:2'-5' RNA ligase
MVTTEMPRTVLHRAFFAILPPTTVHAALDALRRAHCPGGTTVRSDRAHVTLEIFDDHPTPPDALLKRLVPIGYAVVAPAFRLVLDQVSGTPESVALRPSRRSAGLANLQREIDARVKAAGLRVRDRWRFNPHLTLGYRDGASFKRAIAPVAWDVGELVLIHSFVGLTRHKPVARWPLAPELPLFQ